jgi:hypothetical protein
MRRNRNFGSIVIATGSIAPPPERAQQRGSYFAT